MKKILVVGGGAYQVPLIKRITELGHKVYCIDANPAAAGFAYADGFENIDILDRDACLEYAKKIGIDAVMTYGATITLPTVSYIGERLSLPVLPAETAELSKNKYRIKKRLEESGCNIKGDYFLLRSRDDVHRITFPCVIKPCDGSGSKGVSVVHHPSDLPDAMEYAFDSARFGEVYAEAFIHGTEYTVEAFVAHGQAYIYAIVKTTFERLPDGEISYGHRTPSGIHEGTERCIEDEIRKAIRGLGITMGSVNFDVVVSHDDQQVYIIDCGIRVGQNLLGSHIVPLSCGVSVIDHSIALALGELVDAEPKFSKCIATRLLIYHPGTIIEIRDMTDLIGSHGIIDVVMRKQVGDRQGPYQDKSDTCGWVITTGSTPDEAEQNAVNAKELLKNYIIIR